MVLSESIDIPMVEKSKLDEDLQGKPVYATLYCGMIGSLMYLTSSRPDLIYAVCLCAWYLAKPSEKHLNAVKQIFRYLKGTINMGLYNTKETSDMSLTANADVDPQRLTGTRTRKESATLLPQCLSSKKLEWTRFHLSRSQTSMNDSIRRTTTNVSLLWEDLSRSKVSLDEAATKTSVQDEGTGTIPGVPDVPIYESESEKESWGDSEDDENNSDDISDEGDDDNDGNDGNDGDDDDANDDDKQEAISDVATPVIEKNVIKSLEAAVLTRSSSQLQSSYEAAATLSEFESQRSS
ncbi:hypothetical protein Tco_0744372 [Tanacetum coccineum]